jgi:cytochrome oxidase Cu insertion factor (SCO1/SenC/PrrC family)
MKKTYLAKRYKLKKVLGILFISGMATLFALWGTVALATDPLSAAGVVKIKKKISAPGFVIEDLAGNRVNLEDYRGKVVLLNFWTTW